MRKEGNLNKYIHQKHIKALEEFKADLDAWRKETEEEEATLHEDAWTSFTLSNVRIENGCLCYTYDGREEKETIVRYDSEDKCYYEDEGSEGIMEYIKFWRACIRRSKRYWSMDSDTLDKIADGEVEDIE